MGSLFGVVKEFIPFLLYAVSLIAVPLTLSINCSGDTIVFIGIFYSFATSTLMLQKLLSTVYDTWIGVLLGRNVDLKLMGSWAVVTGATDGIGLEYARQLAAKGINIVLMSRSLAKLENCEKEIQEVYGVQTKIVQVDFSQDVGSYEQTVDEQLEGMEIGTLVNNVGMSYDTPEHFDRVAESVDFVKNMLNINVTAVTMMTRAVLPGMLDRGKGVVINVGSVVSVGGGIPYMSLYSATKSYMETFTLTLAKEYGERGIHFQYQCPGYVTTKLAKIKKPDRFIPTPKQYVSRALKSVGLQQCTSVWTSQRIMIPIMRFAHFFFPGPYERLITLLTRTFWLHAKKREMQKESRQPN